MDIQHAFLIFIAFSFIGWCAEVLYVGIFFEHKFVNRGFLHGPLCPVYGFGGVAILCLPETVLRSWILLFVASLVFATAVEYFVSWLLERLFHTLWWDYSDKKINLNGRICLENSLLFGVMGILVVHFCEPLILALIELFNGFWLNVVYYSLVAILFFDVLVTVRRLIDFHTTMERLKNFGDAIKTHYETEAWFRKTNLGEMLSSVKEHLMEHTAAEKLAALHLSYIEKFQDRNKNVEFFLKKFPTLKNAQYKDVIAYFRAKRNQKKN